MLEKKHITIYATVLGGFCPGAIVGFLTHPSAEAALLFNASGHSVLLPFVLPVRFPDCAERGDADCGILAQQRIPSSAGADLCRFLCGNSGQVDFHSLEAQVTGLLFISSFALAVVATAEAIIQEESGTHFDPEIVEAFVKCQDEIKKVMNEV